MKGHRFLVRGDWSKLSGSQYVYVVTIPNCRPEASPHAATTNRLSVGYSYSQTAQTIQGEISCASNRLPALPNSNNLLLAPTCQTQLGTSMRIGWYFAETQVMWHCTTVRNGCTSWPGSPPRTELPPRHANASDQKRMLAWKWRGGQWHECRSSQKASRYR
jgi:hypothetical protein